MNGVQCYELIGGIALNNQCFFFSSVREKESLVNGFEHMLYKLSVEIRLSFASLVERY